MGRLLGAILAGGAARRFGSDKALALLDGRTLLAHVAAGLAPQTDALLLCGRDAMPLDPAPGAPPVPGIADRPAPGLGPLGGLNAALHYARAHGFSHVLTAGCDLPRLPPDLAASLRAAGACAVVATLPVIGLWPAALADRLEAHLAHVADRSLREWARAAGAVPVTLAAPLPNINSRADLAALAEGR